MSSTAARPQAGPTRSAKSDTRATRPWICFAFVTKLTSGGHTADTKTEASAGGADRTLAYAIDINIINNGIIHPPEMEGFIKKEGVGPLS
jgi:hypothetical protein